MASQLPNGKQTFYDENGAPLVGGKVFFYVPNTTTPKDTWQDENETVLNTNPVILDSLGSAVIYGNGVYRQVVEDIIGNQIWDQLTYSSGNTPGGGAATAIYDNKAAVEAITVPANIDVIETLGYANPFDNGGSYYERSALLPAHNGYIQDDSGAIFVLKAQVPALEMFGGFPGGASVTGAWNDLLLYTEKANKVVGKSFNGVYNFGAKPNPITSKLLMLGDTKSTTVYRRQYSEATNADSFITLRQTATGSNINGSGLADISIIAGAGTVNGIMLRAFTEGPVSGFHLFNNVNITYEVGGSFDQNVNFDGMANTTLGGQGIRDITVRKLSLFAPPAATRAFRGANVVALDAEIATFGLSANAGVLITGGTAVSDTDKSQDVRLNLDCIGTTTIEYAKRVVSTGDTNGLVHGILASNCSHYGQVGIDGYSQFDNSSDNICLAPTIAPLAPEVGQLAGFRNAILNGAMQVDQRTPGVAYSITNSWQYTLDRWGVIAGGTLAGTLTAQRVSGAGLSSQNALRIARSAGSFVGNLSIAQPIESRNIWQYLGKRVTLSFKARRGSNFQGNSFAAAIITGTGVDQGIGGVSSGTWTGWANVISAAFTLTTSEQKFKLATVAPLNTNVREIAPLFTTGNYTGTGDANDWFEITEVQLEPGAIDVLYCQYEHVDYTTELNRCRRYCQVCYAQTGVASGQMITTTSARVLIVGPEMRSAAPSIVTNLTNTRIAAGGVQVTPTAASVSGFTGPGHTLNFTTSILTAFESASFTLTGTQTLILDAELN